jgi:hypothetical protein
MVEAFMGSPFDAVFGDDLLDRVGCRRHGVQKALSAQLARMDREHDASALLRAS